LNGVRNLGILRQEHMRIFLDSSTLQTLQTYGEFIYDGGELRKSYRIWSIPEGPENVDALRQLMILGSRGSIEFALSTNSLHEVQARGDISYLDWAFEMMAYGDSCLDLYDSTRNGSAGSAFSGRGRKIYKTINPAEFGYLSKKDFRLVLDAAMLECDYFLTMERKLPKNAGHIEARLGLRVVRPLELMNCLW